MSGIKLLQVTMLASVCAVSVLANDGCGPLEAGRWGLLAGVGAAPGFFKNRGYIQGVDPRLALGCPIDLVNTTTLACDNVYSILNSQADVFVQDACKLPNFNKQFTNGVLHVTGQISYNVCSNTQYFLEVAYNRASGSCINRSFGFYRAPDFCAVNCNDACDTNSNSCSTSCSTSNSCIVVGTPLVESSGTFKLSNYQAYGGYIGARYYWNRVLCDRFSFFTGFKIGMLHRKQVCVTASFPERTVTNAQTGFGDFTFAARSATLVAYCKSNAVSGGIQIGTDYCINDCWSVLVGLELLVTSPFNSNRNIPISVPDPVGQVAGFGNNFPQVTNVLVAPTGCLIQFPIWAGIRWEFDWCASACNEC